MKRDPSNSSLSPEPAAKPLAAPVNHVAVRMRAHTCHGEPHRTTGVWSHVVGIADVGWGAGYVEM